MNAALILQPEFQCFIFDKLFPHTLSHLIFITALWSKKYHLFLFIDGVTEGHGRFDTMPILKHFILLLHLHCFLRLAGNKCSMCVCVCVCVCACVCVRAHACMCSVAQLCPTLWDPMDCRQCLKYHMSISHRTVTLTFRSTLKKLNQKYSGERFTT